MIFTIDIVWAEPEAEPVLQVLLRNDDNRVFVSCGEVSNDQRKLVLMIEHYVNACLKKYEESKNA